jgi:hypothetical protein
MIEQVLVSRIEGLQRFILLLGWRIRSSWAKGVEQRHGAGTLINRRVARCLGHSAAEPSEWTAAWHVITQEGRKWYVFSADCPRI